MALEPMNKRRASTEYVGGQKDGEVIGHHISYSEIDVPTCKLRVVAIYRQRTDGRLHFDGYQTKGDTFQGHP